MLQNKKNSLQPTVDPIEETNPDALIGIFGDSLDEPVLEEESGEKFLAAPSVETNGRQRWNKRGED